MAERDLDVPSRGSQMEKAVSQSRRVIPNLFVVGAPRSATTAMCQILASHPDVFFPDIKEPHFFGSDLQIRRGYATLEEYLEIYAGVTSTFAGDGSTWYLYSTVAAEEIHRVSPDARIIVSLRNPADLLYSWHGYSRSMGIESRSSFAKALEVSRDNPSDDNPTRLDYWGLARYGKQLRRYLDLFGPDRVTVCLYDNFRLDPTATMGKIFEDLDLDPDAASTPRTVNSHAVARSHRLGRLINGQPEYVRNAVRTVVGRDRVRKLRERANNANRRTAKREPLDPDLRSEILEAFRADIDDVAQLTGYDLSHWT